MGVHSTHRTRYSDSSSYDEVCVLCGATDNLGSWGDLPRPCQASEERRQAHDEKTKPKEKTMCETKMMIPTKAFVLGLKNGVWALLGGGIAQKLELARKVGEEWARLNPGCVVAVAPVVEAFVAVTTISGYNPDSL